MTTGLPEARSHPRTIGWVGTTALALGGSNQSLFILGAVLLAQGTAAVPLLAAGLVLSWMAVPGWIELVMMWPNRVGGIAATCAEAFRPYSPVLANLTGVCYWWGWIPTCGLTAILSATAIHEWYLPGVPVKLLAAVMVAAFAAVNLAGIRWVARLATVTGALSAGLAAASAAGPVMGGKVDWRRAASFHLTLPFHGPFAAVTSAMAGLYLIGFAAPAFEAATCHAGETVDCRRNLPRAVFASAGLATLYFVILPVVWLGALGPANLTGDLAATLGPTFAPIFAGAAKGAAIWFMVTNMFHGTLQPLAGAARTISQLSEDGLLPRSLARRNRHDTPWVATTVTAAVSIVLLLSGDPPPVIAAANFCYLIGIALPSVAVWLLRRHQPGRERPWRAPRGTIALGLAAVVGWDLATVFGFEQFGLDYVVLGLVMAYSGSVAYLWRRWRDRVESGQPNPIRRSLHVKLTGPMLAVLALVGTGYVVAMSAVAPSQAYLATLLQDIFVAAAMVAVGVGLVLPGMIAHATAQVTTAAQRLATGTLAELTRAMEALGAGELDKAAAHPVLRPLEVRTRDELGLMASSFNEMQDEIARASRALDGARSQLQEHRDRLQHLADHDNLTGLLNRRRFDTELERLARRHRKRPGRGALVLIDLDNFKLVNDTRGHGAGDAVIRSVADVLKDRLRTTDTVARLGGDEFGILLPHANRDEAAVVAEDVVAAIAGAATITDRAVSVRVTASAGVAVLGGALTSAELLMAAADIALYEAKARGRNQVAFAEGSQPGTAPVARHGSLAGLREALDQDRFTLYGQPIVELETGRATRCELLLRYVDPDGTVWPPGAFLGLAERYGLIAEIDRWVVRKAIAIAATHPDPDLTFEINLSGPSLTDPAILADIERGLDITGMSPGRLVFEVTETAAIASMSEARTFAHRIRGLGCGFALDDFGAGFGSFHYLRNLPFDHLKIDGEFIRDVARHDRDRQVVKAIVDVAGCFGLRTVAEFVEDQATVDVLRQLGVDYGQGFHLGRPAPLPRRAPLPLAAAGR